MLLPSKVFRFPDLKRVGINNWPTLKRRIQNDNFPPGRYVGKNTRVWDEAEVAAWWDSRPKAGPPPDIVVKPAAASRPGEDSSRRETEVSLRHPRNSDSADSAQSLFKRRG
jgi:predicted DNA-binding transcriptional regulator AlpA